LSVTPTTNPIPFPARLWKVVFSPGELFESLREEPRSGAALLTCGLFTLLAVVLIPPEIWVQMMREGAEAEGAELPGFLSSAGRALSLLLALAGIVTLYLMALVLAGIVTFFFAFILGDEGGFKQYLAVVSHGLLISTFGGVLLLPLRIFQGDPEVTLNLGTFLLFLTEGYWLRVLRYLDLFALWALGVMAVGATKMDRKRGFGSALAFFLTLALAFSLVAGILGG
jgi:hypothetical protein